MYQRFVPLLVLLSGALASEWVIWATQTFEIWLMVNTITVCVIIIIWNAKLVRKNANLEKMLKFEKMGKDTFETAEWLNILLNRWWVLSSKSIFGIVQKNLEPLLQEAKPSFLENINLNEFTFKYETPKVISVKAYDVIDGKRVLTQCPEFENECSVALVVGLCINSKEFLLLLNTELVLMGMNINLDVAVEDLEIYGKVELVVTFNLNLPFPHLADVSISFMEKPAVLFNIRMLKYVQLTEIPILKTWIHSAVMDVVAAALVKPKKLLIPFYETQDDPGISEGVPQAHGVLSVSLSTNNFDGIQTNSMWISLKFGKQSLKSTQIRPNWKKSSSFLVQSLESDKLVVKLKRKVLISKVKLAEYEMELNKYSLEDCSVVETVLKNSSPKENKVPDLKIRLEFIQLTHVSFENSLLLRSVDCSVVCGVLTVAIHSAQGLHLGNDDNSQSRCVIFNNKHKILTTPFISSTDSPQWECKCQILVNDYTQCSLSFQVYSSSETENSFKHKMIGKANLSISQGNTFIKDLNLPLDTSSDCTSFVCVSVFFQPVEKVKETASEEFSSSEY